MIAFFPIALCVILGLQFSGGPQYFWDSTAAVYSATGIAIVFGPFTAAVTAFDVNRFTSPSWSQTFPTMHRSGLAILLIGAANALAATIATLITIGVSLAVSARLGSSFVPELSMLLNGFPLLWMGAAIGMLAGRYLPPIIGPITAAIANYSIFLVEPKLFGNYMFTVNSGSSTSSLWPMLIGPLTIAAASSVGVMGLAMVLALRKLAQPSAIFVATLVASASFVSAAAISSSQDYGGDLSREPDSIDLVCAGDAPRVCLPRGQEGYADELQQQLAQHTHVLDDLGVTGPNEYQIMWKLTEPIPGSIGRLQINVPDNWHGEFDDYTIATILANPAVSPQCYPDGDAAERRFALADWIYNQMVADAFMPEEPPTRDEARQFYLEIQDCQRDVTE